MNTAEAATRLLVPFALITSGVKVSDHFAKIPPDVVTV